MTRLLALLLLASICAAAALAFDARTGKYLPAVGEIAVAFTPGDEADDLVTGAIANAKEQVLVQAFSFTHRDIANALIRAQRRGVEVVVIADPEQDDKIETSLISDLVAAKIPVLMDHEHVSAHNKIVVIDAGDPECAVVTGSYNFTHAAQFKNAENLLVLKSNPQVCEAYDKNWKRHRAHSRTYRPGRRF
ncbi:MAG: phospholipase D family protein [Burkholderiales bacterium]